MAVDIKVEPIETLQEVTLLNWLKPDGATVKVGDSIVEFETDKASTEQSARTAGVLRVTIQPGTRVAIGAVIGSIDPNGVAAGGAAPVAPPAAEKAKPAADAPPAEAKLSPAARVMAETQGIDAGKVTPTGRGGVVTKSDLIDAGSKPKEAAPAAPVPAAKPTPPIPVAQPVAPSGPRERREKMSPIRARIAERLLAAQKGAAILTTFNEADMSRIMEMRAKYKDSFQKKHGVGLGFMSFFVKACVEALKAYPAVNARIDGGDIVYNEAYHLGVAVSSEKGLMVPVVRDCDRLSFAGVEKTIVELAGRAREGKITLGDLSGGTFTITNGGIFGSMMSTPILNPPQSGILGMHAIQKRAMVVDDQIVSRPMMYLALSYDHRIIDGKEAVSFLVRVKECLENPERMLIEI